MRKLLLVAALASASAFAITVDGGGEDYDVAASVACLEVVP